MVSIQTNSFAGAKTPIWSRTRLQLGVGLLLAVLIPAAVRIQIETYELQLESLRQSVVGTAVAVMVGYYSFRRLTRFPGVRAAYHVLPSFGAAYGMVLAVFFFGRLDYSRLHFFVSFVVCVTWYYVVYSQLQRQRRLRIGVVPGGDVEHLYAIKEVDWVALKAPMEARGHDALVADLRADLGEQWERCLTDCAIDGMLVMHVKQVTESLTGCVEIEHLSENNFGSLIPGGDYKRVKRVTDILSTLLLLPILLPMMAAIAVAVKLDSPGPILFRQQRMGYRGRPFTMYKFRTMRADEGDPANARVNAITRHNDDRVTRVGRLLRQYRLDELPQAINILKSEMSWIGPRPEAVPLSLWYESELPFYRYRHIVRPGLTGWAQVKQGHVAEVDEVLSKLHYDFYYIKNFSFWLDVLIVAGTIRTVLSGFGAR